MKIFALLRNFKSAVGGFAATEFALIAPIMIIIFFGILETAGALSCSRRNDIAANTLADLVSQESQIDDSILADLYVGVGQILGNSGANTTFTVMSVIYDKDDDAAYVDWCNTSQGAAPYAKGDVYTGAEAAVIIATQSALVIVQSSTDYSPIITSKFIPSSTLSVVSSRLPRRAVRVLHCGASC